MILPSSLKQNSGLLVDNKKLIILSVHNYSSKTNFTKESHLKLKLRKQVAETLVILRIQLGVLC
jgi:hypothetical protein